MVKGEHSLQASDQSEIYVAREPKLTSTRWILMSRSRKERFRHVLANRSLKDAFDNDLFKMIDRRRSELERTQWRLVALIGGFPDTARSPIGIHVRHR